MLERMILQVVGRAPQAGVELRRGPRPPALGGGARRAARRRRSSRGLAQPFRRRHRRDVLREGVTFDRAEDAAEGLRIVLEDRGITLDLSDAAVASALAGSPPAALSRAARRSSSMIWVDQPYVTLMASLPAIASSPRRDRPSTASA
ncbi:MAG: hypothetical protein R3C69_12575 [Geminicoccaceae bacterium]